jgi:hypothetical protein
VLQANRALPASAPHSLLWAAGAALAALAVLRAVIVIVFTTFMSLMAILDFMGVAHSVQSLITV